MSVDSHIAAAHREVYEHSCTPRNIHLRVALDTLAILLCRGDGSAQAGEWGRRLFIFDAEGDTVRGVLRLLADCPNAIDIGMRMRVAAALRDVNEALRAIDILHGVDIADGVTPP